MLATSIDGWSSTELGFAWLKKFEEQTRVKGELANYLLILDGHSSYTSEKLIEDAVKYRVNLATLPSHVTHFLQLLNVSVSSPLPLAYGRVLNAGRMYSGGLANMGKDKFYPLFWSGWNSAVTEANKCIMILTNRYLAL